MKHAFLTSISILFSSAMALAMELPPPSTPPVPPVVGAPSTPSTPVSPPAKAKAGPVTELRCWAGQWPANRTGIYFENEILPVPERASVTFDRTVDDIKFTLYFTNRSMFLMGAFEMGIEDLKTGYKAAVSHEDPVFHANGNMNVRLMKTDPANPAEKTGVFFGCRQQNSEVEPPGWID